MQTAVRFRDQARTTAYLPVARRARLQTCGTTPSFEQRSGSPVYAILGEIRLRPILAAWKHEREGTSNVPTLPLVRRLAAELAAARWRRSRARQRSSRGRTRRPRLPCAGGGGGHEEAVDLGAGPTVLERDDGGRDPRAGQGSRRPVIGLGLLGEFAPLLELLCVETRAGVRHRVAEVVDRAVLARLPPRSLRRCTTAASRRYSRSCCRRRGAPVWLRPPRR